MFKCLKPENALKANSIKADLMQFIFVSHINTLSVVKINK